VTTDWVEKHLADNDVVVLEVSFHPAPAALYHAEGHIPGSHHRWWKDLCWDETTRAFPEPATMAARLAELGVGDDSTLVLVGDTIQFATYAYWVLAMTGLDHLARVMDGGHQAWVAEGRETTSVIPPPPGRGTVAPATPDDSTRVGRDDVLAGLGDPNRVLLDLRSDEEYTGERVSPSTAPFDHGAERKGRIPGARHLPHTAFLRDDGTFRDAGEIGELLDEAGAGDDADVVTYCRLSHRASLGWFAATLLADRGNVRVYDGSWTEWGSMVGMPIDR
jgi:thiosulfate/3-mercaptopyruvate sulfurtransferase